MTGRAAGIFLLFLLILGCKKEYSFEGGTPARKCVGCDYLPLCDSSVFVYVDSSSRIDTLTGVVRLGRDSTIDGVTYSHVTGFAAFPDGLLYNCSGGDYKTVINPDSFGFDADSIVQLLLGGIQLPFPIPPGLIKVPEKIKTSFLKTGVPVNATWTDTIYHLSFPPILKIFAGLDYKLVSKDAQRPVFQKTFKDVYQVNAKLRATSTLGNFPIPDITVDYFFAKGVGIIEIQVRENGVMTRVTKLWKYVL